MTQYTLHEKLKELILPTLEALGFELFDLKAGRENLQIFIDKEDGVSIKDCVKVNRHIGDVLEANSEFAERFSLEVSSPGAERPLRSANDYKKKQGYYAQLKVMDSETSICKSITGKIGSVSDISVEIILNKGIIEEILFSNIVKAHLKVS